MHNQYTVKQMLKIVEGYYQERYKQVVKLRDMLRYFEWMKVESGDLVCPICHSFKQYGHAQQCQLAELLEDPPRPGEWE